MSCCGFRATRGIAVDIIRTTFTKRPRPEMWHHYECGECGAFVSDPTTHARWHASLMGTVIEEPEMVEEVMVSGQNTPSNVTPISEAPPPTKPAKPTTKKAARKSKPRRVNPDPDAV